MKKFIFNVSVRIKNTMVFHPELCIARTKENVVKLWEEWARLTPSILLLPGAEYKIEKDTIQEISENEYEILTKYLPAHVEGKQSNE